MVLKKSIEIHVNVLNKTKIRVLHFKYKSLEKQKNKLVMNNLKSIIADKNPKILI